jgi:cytochrome c553
VLGTPIATTSKHDVDGVARTAWGRGDISAIANAGTSVTLTCGSCHDPHGNGQYRILKPTPEGAYSGAYAGPPTVAAMSNIAIADGTAWTYTTTNYWAPADATATEYNTKVSSWCASCHTRYLAGSGAGSTSSTDAVFNYRHRTNGSTGTTACVVCHVSHGSNAAMGTNSQAVPLPGATLGRGTDSSLLRVDNRGVCQQCHTK